MLDQFYELQGWDKKTGLQTRETLIKLGMENVVQKLEEAGRLIDSKVRIGLEEEAWKT